LVWGDKSKYELKTKQVKSAREGQNKIKFIDRETNIEQNFVEIVFPNEFEKGSTTCTIFDKNNKQIKVQKEKFTKSTKLVDSGWIHHLRLAVPGKEIKKIDHDNYFSLHVEIFDSSKALIANFQFNERFQIFSHYKQLETIPKKIQKRMALEGTPVPIKTPTTINKTIKKTPIKRTRRANPINYHDESDSESEFSESSSSDNDSTNETNDSTTNNSTQTSTNDSTQASITDSQTTDEPKSDCSFFDQSMDDFPQIDYSFFTCVPTEFEQEPLSDDSFNNIESTFEFTLTN